MNRIVLITGGATGIGAGCATRFAKDKDTIIIHYNKSELQANKLAKTLSKFTTVDLIQADLANEEEICKMFNKIQKKYQKLDILINNAGISFEKLLIDTPYADISSMLNINLKAPILCSKNACELMLKQRSGNIINISSIYGISGASAESIYSACKAGLIAFTKSLAREMGDAGIRINAIAPGAIDTDMNKNFTKVQQRTFFINSAIKRMGSPEEIANVAYFLASTDSSYITGQTIIADGCTI